MIAGKTVLLQKGLNLLRVLRSDANRPYWLAMGPSDPAPFYARGAGASALEGLNIQIFVPNYESSRNAASILKYLQVFLRRNFGQKGFQDYRGWHVSLRQLPESFKPSLVG